MENPGLFTMLQPKQTQFVLESAGGGYRPKSTMAARKRKVLDTSEDQQMLRPPSQQSGQSKQSKRIIYVSRNGKKKEPLDDDYRSIQRPVMTQDAVSPIARHSLNVNGFQSKRKITHRYNVQRTEEEDQALKTKSLRKQQQSQPTMQYEEEHLTTAQQEPEEPASQACLSDIDPFLLDSISVNDPIWSQILPESLIDQVDIAKLIEDNPEYFHHHLGLCACYKCKCGRCRCDIGNQVKLRVNGALLTIYGKDYAPKQSQEYNKLQALNAMNYQTRFLEQQTIDQQSTKQSDFQFKRPFKFESMQNYPQTTIGTISSMTSYRQTFGNWGVQDYALIKRVPHVSTSGEIPFMGKSNYQETFCVADKPKAETPKYRTTNLQKFPLIVQVAVANWSILRNNNQPGSLHSLQDFEVQDHPDQAYSHTPIYDGQYRSTFTRDYRGDLEEQCPAPMYKKAWKQKLIQKYNQLRDLRMQKQLSLK